MCLSDAYWCYWLKIRNSQARNISIDCLKQTGFTEVFMWRARQPNDSWRALYLWKVHFWSLNMMDTLLPASRLLPVMLTIVPPDTGPRLGFKLDNLGTCRNQSQWKLLTCNHNTWKQACFLLFPNRIIKFPFSRMSNCPSHLRITQSNYDIWPTHKSHLCLHKTAKCYETAL